jgi:hypothetical protein
MCPLCHNYKTQSYHSDKKRDYLQCTHCELVFVAPQFLPTPDQEKAEYDLHQNEFDDSGYVGYLSRIMSYIPADFGAVKQPVRALDFGCGPSPVLAALIARTFSLVSYYDPMYFCSRKVLDQKYDLITCTEAIEHFHQPHREWSLLTSMLSDQGILLVMTKRVLDAQRFASWHYKNDQTHVSFFSETTFHYLARETGLSVTFPTSDIAVFRKR